MRQVVLDTDPLSYILNRRHPEVLSTGDQYIRVFRYFTVSAVTISEIVEGFETAQDHERVAVFLKLAEDFEVMRNTDEATNAGQILGALSRTGQKVGELDPFIAATAICRKWPLVTNNIRHYQRIVDLGFPLELENWRKL